MQRQETVSLKFSPLGAFEQVAANSLLARKMFKKTQLWTLGTEKNHPKFVRAKFFHLPLLAIAESESYSQLGYRAMKFERL